MVVVVKVGGSLFDWPELGAKLRAFLASLRARKVLVVPGGGATADAIRVLDRVHQLGAEASHWLALDVLSVNARFLQRLLPEARIVAEFSESSAQTRVGEASLACASGSEVAILDPYPFFQKDERRPDPLPHSWQVTSDALAVRAAVLFQARELILLKSVDWAGADWEAANRAGVVDGYFADAMKKAPAEMFVRVINLRAWA